MTALLKAAENLPEGVTSVKGASQVVGLIKGLQMLSILKKQTRVHGGRENKSGSLSKVPPFRPRLPLTEISPSYSPSQLLKKGLFFFETASSLVFVSALPVPTLNRYHQSNDDGVPLSHFLIGHPQRGQRWKSSLSK